MDDRRRRRKQGPEGEYNKLFQALARAILGSHELGALLESLASKGLLGPSNLLVITLKIRDRKGGLAPSLEDLRAATEEGEGADSDELAQYINIIDGKRLSLQEIAFEEYYKHRFDEAQWLKKNRLTLKSPRAKRSRSSRKSNTPDSELPQP